MTDDIYFFFPLPLSLPISKLLAFPDRLRHWPYHPIHFHNWVMFANWDKLSGHPRSVGIGFSRAYFDLATGPFNIFQ